MKSVPKQKNEPFEFTVEFSGSDLIALEKIGEYSNTTENFLTLLSYVSANILTAPSDDLSEQKRNDTIEAVRRAVADLQNARDWLFHSEYPDDLIGELSRWADELRPTVKRRYRNDSRQELVPPDFLAVGSVAAIFQGFGFDVQANSQTSAISPFLMALDIVFRAAGQKRSDRSLSDSFYRLSRRWGLVHFMDDARYLSHPSFQNHSERIDISYTRKKSFVAKFQFIPIRP